MECIEYNEGCIKMIFFIIVETMGEKHFYIWNVFCVVYCTVSMFPLLGTLVYTFVRT